MSDRMRYLRPERFGNLVPRAHYADSAAPSYSPDPAGKTPPETVPQVALAPPPQHVSPALRPFSKLPSQKTATVLRQKSSEAKSGKQAGASASSAGAKSDVPKTAKIIHFDTARLHQLLVDLYAEDIHYERAKGRGKVANISQTEPADLQGAGIDCSGFVQYVIRKLSSEHSFPGGSINQKDWCKARFAKIDYESKAALQDNYLRIGFRKTILGKIITPRTATTPAKRAKKKQVGHVWLVINGQTYESTTKKDQFGKRNNGPASLQYSERNDDADFFYTLGPVPGFALLCSQAPIT